MNFGLAADASGTRYLLVLGVMRIPDQEQARRKIKRTLGMV
jgi:hypothetical protein